MTALLFNLPELPPCPARIESRWSLAVKFVAHGIPRPGGSKKASFIPKRGGGFVTRANGQPIIAVRDAGGEKTANWRSVVAHEAAIAFAGEAILDERLALRVVFVMPRPKGHYNSKGILKASAPLFHASAPDATKLTRSLEDALTGIVWKDDSRIGRQDIFKIYGEKPGAHVEVFRLEGAE